MALVSSVAALAPIAAASPAAAVEQTWSARGAHLAGAADLAKGGKGITIAVLDTWIEGRHPDFGGRVRPGVTCFDGACRPDSGVSDGCQPHGTHVAGIAAGSRFGVAPKATILPVRVLTYHRGKCMAESNDVAKGVEYAASHGAQVINISLGSTYPLAASSDELVRAVASAAAQNIVVVVAAGNGQAPGSNIYGKSALVVAALAADGQIASYSQRGAGVDIAAPGGDPGKPNRACNPNVCVVSDWSNGGYAADSGTSMAAPYVAGAAALLLAQNPQRGRAEVAATLLTTAKRIRGSAGAGAVDVLAAVQKPASLSTGSGTDPVVGGSGVSAPSASPQVDAPAGGLARPSSRPTLVTADPASSNSSLPSWGVPAVIAALLLFAAAGFTAMVVRSSRGRR